MRALLTSSLLFLFCCALPLNPLFSQNQWLPRGELARTVYEYPLKGFSEADYEAAVETFFRVYEKESARQLVPGEKGKVGIKIYTASGPGLMTPPALTEAVIQALERRGFNRSNLFIVDLYDQNLRESGYLPRRGTGEDKFNGVPVIALDSGQHYNLAWFYENNLPSRERAAQQFTFDNRFTYQPDPDERKSFLPYPLFMEADFWINLPMVADNEALGVSGAIGNATVWSVSNNTRFLVSPANAPVAAAEIAAIPEYRGKWVMTIMTLESYQFMGGPRFHALYTRQEPRIWMSANPVALDFLMFRRIQRAREQENIPGLKEIPPIFEYAKVIGLGAYQPEELRLIRLAPPKQKSGGE